MQLTGNTKYRLLGTCLLGYFDWSTFPVEPWGKCIAEKPIFGAAIGCVLFHFALFFLSSHLSFIQISKVVSSKMFDCCHLYDCNLASLGAYLMLWNASFPEKVKIFKYTCMFLSYT